MENLQSKSVNSEEIPETRFCLHTLGELVLFDENNLPVKLRTRKSLLLLACLVSQPNRAASREWLAGVIWSDRQNEQARNSLRTALSDIRRAAGKDTLATDGADIRLEYGKVTSDIEKLRQLSKSEIADDPGALRTYYNGDFLAGVYDEIAAPDWLANIRAEARDCAGSVLMGAVDYLAQAGQNDVAILRARELLSLDPLSEKSHRLLMQLYNAGGERSKAIAQFRSCRELLNHELGIEPSEETRQVADSIALRNDAFLPQLDEIASRHSQFPANAVEPSGDNSLTQVSPNSIAILPFVNMSGDADQDYFAEGISEDIVTDLAKITGLSVAPAGSTRLFRSAMMRPGEIAGELNVKYILEGSVRRSEQLLRITASLIDAGADRQVWGERYDRELTKIFDVQAEISANVAKAVRSKVAPTGNTTTAKRGTASVEAHQRYLQGRALTKEMTRNSVELAITFFEQAIEIDGQYAQAYAGLAESISMLGWHYEVDKSLLEQAVGNARKALELNAGLAESYCSLGRCNSLFLKTDEAEKDFQRAISLSPELQEAHLYRALMYLTIGRAEEALDPLRTAFKLEKRDLQAGMMLLNCLETLNKTDELRAAAKQVLKLAHDRMKLNPYDDQAAYVGANALKSLGETEKAMSWANVAASYDISDPRTTYNVACLFAVLGEFEKALDLLSKTIEYGVPNVKMQWIRHHDGDWAQIRDSDRFRKVVGLQS